jgi:hypothetical protein
MLDFILISFCFYRGTRKEYSTNPSNKFLSQLSIILSYCILWKACDLVENLSKSMEETAFESETFGCIAGLVLLPICAICPLVISRQIFRTRWVLTKTLQSIIIYTGGILAVISWRTFIWSYQSNDAPKFVGSQCVFLATKWAMSSYLASLILFDTDSSSAGENLFRILTASALNVAAAVSQYLCARLKLPYSKYARKYPRKLPATPPPDSHHASSKSDIRSISPKHHETPITVGDTGVQPSAATPLPKPGLIVESRGTEVGLKSAPHDTKPLSASDRPNTHGESVPSTPAQQEKPEPIPTPFDESPEPNKRKETRGRTSTTPRIRVFGPDYVPKGKSAARDAAPQSGLLLPPSVERVFSNLSKDQKDQFSEVMNAYKSTGAVQSRRIRSLLLGGGDSDKELKFSLYDLLKSLKMWPLNGADATAILLESLALNCFFRQNGGPVRRISVHKRHTLCVFGDLLGSVADLEALIDGGSLLKFLDYDDGVIIFNGNTISVDGASGDNSSTDLNVILFVLLLQLLFPNHVIVVAGSNETRTDSLLWQEAAQRYPKIPGGMLSTVLSLLPLAVLVNESIFFSPDGIPIHQNSDRVMTIAQMSTSVEIGTSIKFLRPAMMIGIPIFDNRIVEEFLEINNLKLLVQSTLPVLAGADVLCLTFDPKLGYSFSVGTTRALIIAVQSSSRLRRGEAAVLLLHTKDGLDWNMSVTRAQISTTKQYS